MKVEDKVQQYYSSISQFDGESGFVSILPGPETSDYDEIMEGLVNKTKTEIEELLAIINDSTTTREDSEYLSEYLSQLEAVRTTLVEKRIRDIKEEEKEEQEITNNGKDKIVIFACNNYGNCPVIDDLNEIFKNSDKETRISFLKMLNELRENVSYDEEKARAFNNNIKLKGVFERKEYQSRLFYQYAAGCIVVIGASIKKSDNDKRDHNVMISRKQGAADFIEHLKSNKDNRDYIIALADKTDALLSDFTNTKSL